MKVTELGAAPQTAEATSKISTLVKSVYRTEKKVNSFPNRSCNAQHVNMYALPYQP
jgi:hypothetical protein